jgi:hypothetical protein
LQKNIPDEIGRVIFAPTNISIWNILTPRAKSKKGSSIDGLPGAGTFSTVQLSHLHTPLILDPTLGRGQRARRTRSQVECRGACARSQRALATPLVSVELRPRRGSCEILAPLRLRSWELAGPLACGQRDRPTCHAGGGGAVDRRLDLPRRSIHLRAAAACFQLIEQSAQIFPSCGAACTWIA